MNRHRARIRKLRIGWKTPLLLASLGLAMAACGDKAEVPLPPHTPPKPVMGGGKVFTAQLDLSARPVRPSPGEM